MIFDKWRCSSCMKSVRIRSYCGPYFPAFGLNTKRYSVSLRIQSECGEMRIRITPNTDTFYAVNVFLNKVAGCRLITLTFQDKQLVIPKVKMALQI